MVINYIKILVLATIFMLLSCDHNVTIQQEEPLVVEHKLNLDNLSSFFWDLCNELLPPEAGYEDVDDCHNESLYNFFKILK